MPRTAANAARRAPARAPVSRRAPATIAPSRSSTSRSAIAAGSRAPVSVTICATRSRYHARCSASHRVAGVAELRRRAEEGAAPEAVGGHVGPDPPGEVEQCVTPLARRTLDDRQHAHALPVRADAQVGQDQVVLRREVPVQRHARRSREDDDVLDAHGAHASFVEQRVGRVENSCPRRSAGTARRGHRQGRPPSPDPRRPPRAPEVRCSPWCRIPRASRNGGAARNTRQSEPRCFRTRIVGIARTPFVSSALPPATVG